MRDRVQRHPACFEADTVEQVQQMAEAMLPPTDAAEQALAEAEDACGPSREARSGGPPQTPLADTPDQAVTDARALGDDPVPQGEAVRTFEGDGLVGFSFRHGGEFTGWMLTVRSDRGWYVRHALECAGPATEMATESSTAR